MDEIIILTATKLTDSQILSRPLKYYKVEYRRYNIPEVLIAYINLLLRMMKMVLIVKLPVTKMNSGFGDRI